MNVRTRLQVSAVLPVLLALMISVILYWTAEGVSLVTARFRTADNLALESARLNVTTHRYAMHPTRENQDRWLELHQRIGMLLIREKASSPDDQQLMEQIRRTHSGMRDLFVRLSAPARDPEQRVPESEDATLEAIWVKSAVMVGNVNTLAANGHKRVADMQERAYLLIVGVSAILAGLLAFSGLAIGRRIARGVQQLQAGADRVKAGDLTQSIPVDGEDEVAVLEGSFNGMMESLRQAREQLENEIRHQASTAQSLRETNVRLSASLERLRRAQGEMAQQERLQALRQVSEGMVHDLNDSLMPILGLSDYLMQFPDVMAKVDEVRDCVTAMHESATRAARVVRNLTEFFSPAGRQDAGPVDLNAVVKEVVSLLEPMWKDRRQAEGRPVDCTLHLGSVPAFHGRSMEVREILTHLIVNAVDAMTEGGTLTIRTLVEGSTVLIEVTDTGVGMDAETCLHCFETFFSTKGKDHSGMGLTIVRGCARRWGGNVDIKKTGPGKGTTLVVRLPMKLSNGIPAGEPVRKAPARALRILVVDDHPWVRQVIEQTLTHAGHTVVACVNGETGIKQSREGGRFDLAILDRALPDMSGDLVAQELKRGDSSLPVLMVTGFGEFMLGSGDHPAGVDRILSKPVTRDELLAAVADLAG